MYRLKEGVEDFKVVDGPMAGKKFKKGKEYAEVPPGEEGRFEERPTASRSGATHLKGKGKNPKAKRSSSEAAL